MGEGPLRHRLRFLRRRPRPRPRAQDPYLFLNDAPRPPAIALPERISDASSRTSSSTASTQPASRPSTPSSPAADDVSHSSHDLRSENASHHTVCLVCLDDLPVGASCVRLPCQHSSWHSRCIREWLRRAPRCPLCSRHVPARRACYGAHFSGEWRIWERRVHEHRFDRESHTVEHHPRFSSQDLSWLLYDRRLSSVGRPPHQPQPTRCFARSVTTRR